jgi:plasmid maintenance system antidote protein VapI
VVEAKRRIDAAEARTSEARTAFVEALRDAIAAGYSQADLARACGVTRARINQLIAG